MFCRLAKKKRRNPIPWRHVQSSSRRPIYIKKRGDSTIDQEVVYRWRRPAIDKSSREAPNFTEDLAFTVKVTQWHWELRQYRFVISVQPTAQDAGETFSSLCFLTFLFPGISFYALACAAVRSKNRKGERKELRHPRGNGDRALNCLPYKIITDQLETWTQMIECPLLPFWWPPRLDVFTLYHGNLNSRSVGSLWCTTRATN